MAAPHVTASIALMMAKFPNSSPEELIKHLCQQAYKKNLQVLQVHDGQLDLAKALEGVPKKIEKDNNHNGNADT